MEHHAPPTKPFFQSYDGWDIYRRILAHNYMFTHEIYAVVKDLFLQRFQGKSFSVLDLGCGDVSLIAKALEESQVSYYKGIDISPVSLESAQHNILRLGCPTEFLQADLLQGIQMEKSLHDVLFASYSVHHLTSTQKTELFQHCYQRLLPGGIFVLIDVLREAEETLEQYLENYCYYMRTHWTIYTSDEMTDICQHVIDYDLPETMTQIVQMVQQAGFTNDQVLYKHLWYNMLLFEKPLSLL